MSDWFQTRSEIDGLQFFDTLKEAFEAAKKNPTIWKVSFTISETSERVRLVKANLSPFVEIKDQSTWFYEPIEQS